MKDFVLYSRYRAMYSPKRMADLKPGSAAFIGKTGVFEAIWRISKDDGGPYVGLWAMGVPREWMDTVPKATRWGDCWVWVPACDIEGAQEIFDEVEGLT
ncbi:hypothetical protein [Chelatococcus reniformis]|uniref:Uncharacterized protein n=1 Tax=Chelatococcus reniformis TaxID=1494448 RepID=A0A916UVA2_9HYPH|nr:hypothetical protein [Chelatococcus reniformis]GGC86783.1 hypothetical protein GCM10010994_50890 [Chelatococcus reniformis]